MSEPDEQPEGIIEGDEHSVPDLRQLAQLSDEELERRRAAGTLLPKPERTDTDIRQAGPDVSK